mgnify:CR=1 FL=1
MTGNIGIYGGEPAGVGLAPVGLKPEAGTGLIALLVQALAHRLDAVHGAHRDHRRLDCLEGDEAAAEARRIIRLFEILFLRHVPSGNDPQDN